MLIPPLFGLLLSDQLGGSQRVSQQLTDILGLLMSIFNSCCTGTLPKVQTHVINTWSHLIVRKLWTGLIYLPHLTQAFWAVVERWCSHRHAPVQLLQQEATYTLHYLKIREINQDLWGYGNTLQYMHSGICERSWFLPQFTSASMRYCSPSLCRNFLTEASLSLTPCCLLKWKLQDFNNATNENDFNTNLMTACTNQRNSVPCVVTPPHSFKEYNGTNAAFHSDVFVHSRPPYKVGGNRVFILTDIF